MFALVEGLSARAHVRLVAGAGADDGGGGGEMGEGVIGGERWVWRGGRDVWRGIRRWERVGLGSCDGCLLG